MTDLQLQPNERLFAPAPSMHSLKPALFSALADREYVFDGGPPWLAERALDLAARQDAEHLITGELLALRAATKPVPPKWLADRLTILWTQFMVARTVDARALAVWMGETINLLADLPHDIVAHAIDQAVKKAKHGFIPSVGEIRQFADPLVLDREEQLARLTAMSAALDDPEATKARQDRRRIAAAARGDEAGQAS